MNPTTTDMIAQQTGAADSGPTEGTSVTTGAFIGFVASLLVLTAIAAGSGPHEGGKPANGWLDSNLARPPSPGHRSRIVSALAYPRLVVLCVPERGPSRELTFSQ
jgi:hypothetical protein